MPDPHGEDSALGWGLGCRTELAGRGLEPETGVPLSKGWPAVWRKPITRKKWSLVGDPQECP